MTLDRVPVASAQGKVSQHRERKARGLSQGHQLGHEIGCFQRLGRATPVEQSSCLDTRNHAVIDARPITPSSGHDLHGVSRGEQRTHALAHEYSRGVVGKTWVRRGENADHGGGDSGMTTALGPCRRCIPRSRRAQIPRTTSSKSGATTRGMRIPECQSAP